MHLASHSSTGDAFTRQSELRELHRYEPGGAFTSQSEQRQGRPLNYRLSLSFDGILITHHPISAPFGFPRQFGASLDSVRKQRDASQLYMYVASLLHLAHHVLTDLGSRATRHFTIWSPSTEAVHMGVTGCDTVCFTQVEPIVWRMACRDRTRQLLVVFSSTGKQSCLPSVGVLLTPPASTLQITECLFCLAIEVGCTFGVILLCGTASKMCTSIAWF